jgi:hypothetical protein
MRWIKEPKVRTIQGPGAMIMDRTNIRIKNGAASQLRYMRNRRHIKLGSVKSAMTNNRKRSTISSLN